MKFLKITAAALVLFCMNVSTYAADNMQIVKNMRLGWNLGNTFDSYGGGSDPDTAETYWVHVKTDKQMIDDIKAQGFNAVRIPVTWYEKVNNGKINADWLARVKEVVDYCIEDDMYVILNTHHEEGYIVPTYAKADSSEAYLRNLWSQIAPYFKDYDEHLVFETLNEPRITGDASEWTNGTEETRSVINRLNKAALEEIRKSGGNNSERLVMCPGNAASIPASTGFELPDDENIALSVHHYAPYGFAMDKDGTKYWGSEEDKTALDSELKGLYNRFVSKGVPVIIGEMGATDKMNTSARETWAKFYAQTAKSYGITCFVWDNNVITTDENDCREHYGLYNRNSHTWYYQSIAKAFSDGVNAAVPYTGGTSDPYTLVLFDRTVSLTGWDNESVGDPPELKEGYYITVKYSGDAPNLVFQNYTIDGEWNTIQPEKTENGVAYYSYNDIVNGCRAGYAKQNKMYVSAKGSSLSFSEVCVVTPHKTGDVSGDGKVNGTDAKIILLDISNIRKMLASDLLADIDGSGNVNLLDVIKALK
ncbi:MAG: cellulase family glycosylhydrolase [Firmicutes bacterium]|nr:cellulase family glycosylhydrolase [Bacillota bacterium]